MRKKTICILGAMIILMISVSSCNKDLDLVTSTSSTSETDQFSMGKELSSENTDFYLLANGTQLDRFNFGNLRDNSPQASGSATFTGLQPGETILGIDFRPATGQLYGLGSSSRLYVIEPTTGAARMIGTGPFTPALNGTLAGFDFNPTVDRIRVVTDLGQNLRLNPETGTTAAIDGNINGQEKVRISAVAYTNNFAGATTTTLFDIDPLTNSVYRQDPPNNGTLVTVGSLNRDIEGEGSFDISPTGSATALFKINNVPTLLDVNLTTGFSSVLAIFPGIEYSAMAIPTRSVAYATTSSNQLYIFSLDGRGVIIKNITGLSSGETLLGLDMRPLNGQLYALGSNFNIYTINSASGAATLAYNLNTVIPGKSFGFDFNPVVDRIRILSNTGENRRFNPNDGTLIVDGNLNPGSPQVSSAAYNNNFAGTLSTTLFAIDHSNNKLYSVNPPNAGTLVFIGNTQLNVQEFDFGGTSNKGYITAKTGSNTHIYQINPATGQTTFVGFLGSAVINGFAVGLGF